MFNEINPYKSTIYPLYPYDHGFNSIKCEHQRCGEVSPQGLSQNDSPSRDTTETMWYPLVI